jgi:chitin synthase
LNVPTEFKEIDAAWKRFKKELEDSKTSKSVDHKPVNEKESNEDSTKEFRTKIVLFWILCNLLLVVLFTNSYSLNKLFPHQNGVNPYLTFLFWSVAFLSFVRFFGSAVYMIQWWKEKMVDRREYTHKRLHTDA